MIQTMSTQRTLAALFALGFASCAAAQTTIYVDFGSGSVAGSGWNTIGSSGSAYTVSNLVNSANVATTVGLDVNGSFSSTGAGVASGIAAFTSTASGQTHTFVAGSVGDYLAGTTAGVFTFTGLDTTKTYTIEFFASRASGGAGRNTQFVVSNAGLSADSTVTLNAGDNVSNTAFVAGFAPSAGGQLTITVSAIAPTNGFHYLNALALTAVPAAVPEPSAFAALAGLGALGAVALRRRRR